MEIFAAIGSARPRIERKRRKMRIEFRLIDDLGKSYEGAVELQPAEARRTALRSDPKKHLEESRSLPEQILALRETGFFREPRTPQEVHEKLQETYHCLMDRVQMALLRLSRKHELRKTVKTVGKQEESAYAW